MHATAHIARRPHNHDATWNGSSYSFNLQNVFGILGDYNGNGVVDAGDYVLYRKGGPLQNEVDAPGTVNFADYTAWRARYGNASGSALNSSAVPEPQVLLLALCSLIGAALARKHR